MNEHVALQWPRMTLARELPFSLAGTLVRPASLEVETDGRVTPLEPRVMKVLVALHRARGQPVSRDELIDLCWEGRIVTEGALNRCVAQLRKALAANPRIKLDTIATVGYRLQASAEVRRVTPLGPAASDPAPFREAPAPAVPFRRPILGLAAALAVAAAAVAVAAWPRQVDWSAERFHPLTSERGLETHPALSPDGEQIAYAQRADVTVRRDLFIRGVDEGTPVRITSHPDDDHSPSWSPRGDRLAFVRTPPDGSCSLVVVPVPLGPERTVARCQNATYTRVSWLNDHTLVIGDRPSPSALFRLRAIDLASGAARDITWPDASTLGDGDPMASPDGRKVVFRRTLMHGADDLYLLDVGSGRVRPLTTDGWKAAGWVWSADSRHVFYASNRGGEFGLWTTDTAIDAPPKRISLGFGQITFSRMSSDRRNRLAVEIPRGRTNLAALTPSGAATPVTNSGGSDWDPEVLADGTVAYVSSRNGAPEVWVTHPDGQSVRLTSIVGSYVHSPAWSPNGQDIAFVAVKGRRSEIYVVGRDGSRFRPLTEDGLDKLDPAFSPDGRSVRYLERQGAGYRLMEVSLAQGARPAAVPGGAGWRQLRAAPDGRLFGVRVGSETVEALSGAAPRVRVASNDAWTAGPDGIYVLTARRREPPAIWLHPWAGPARKLADVETACCSIGVGPDGRVVYSRNLDDEVDLGLLDLAVR